MGGPDCARACLSSDVNPTGISVSPMNVFGGELELRSTAVTTNEPENSQTQSLVLFVRQGATATSDQYTWILPRPQQDTAALQDLPPYVQTAVQISGPHATTTITGLTNGTGVRVQRRRCEQSR